MRTTVRLDDDLLRKAKAEAVRRGETLTGLIERSLREMLARLKEPSKKRHVRIPVSRARGGTQPGVNLDDSADVLEIMEGRG
jgi:hypothetical protein